MSNARAAVRALLIPSCGGTHGRWHTTIWTKSSDPGGLGIRSFLHYHAMFLADACIHLHAGVMAQPSDD